MKKPITDYKPKTLEEYYEMLERMLKKKTTKKS